MTALAASEPAGVTIASPRGTGAWRTAANSIASPPARLMAPETPVDIHSERFAGLTMASTSRSQISPFQSSIRANYPLHPVSVRIPTTAPVAAWYTRGSRADIEVTTSQVFVVRCRARSSTVMRSSPWHAEQHELILAVDRRARDVGHVGHDRVHRHVADERDAPPANERLRPVGVGAGEPIAVAERQGRDPARALTS